MLIRILLGTIITMRRVLAQVQDADLEKSHDLFIKLFIIIIYYILYYILFIIDLSH